MGILNKLSEVLNKILLVLGGITVLALMLMATGNVVLRIFHLPFRGTYEIVGFLGAVVIAFALGYTQQRKDHIVVDILTEKFSKRTNRILNAINYLVTMLFFGIVSWQVLIWGFKIWREGELSETLKVIFYPFVLCVGAGFAVLTLVLFNDLLQSVFKQTEKGDV
ncbi:MAG: TRAP transporter small permease [Desulfobacterota bacterium]|jgi:TRAP-type C4-dicarboxylate transport system permease small subunit|nr:TRAP transporter small permease [Thermodesulfobacteriota bacterium]